jgi:hypothetical protein
LNRSVEAVLARWRADGVPLQPGICAKEVTALLAQVGRETSRDVLELFEAANGMIRDESDDHVFSWWPVEQSAQECSRFEQCYVPFADFLLSSHEYCFKRESSARSSVFIHCGEANERQIAATVEEFFHLLLTDPMRLEVAL